MSTQVTYETNQVILLQDSRKQLNYNINSKKQEMFKKEISIIIIILVCRKLGSVGTIQQKITLPLPNSKYCSANSLLDIISFLTVPPEVFFIKKFINH